MIKSELEVMLWEQVPEGYVGPAKTAHGVYGAMCVRYRYYLGGDRIIYLGDLFKETHQGFVRHNIMEPTCIGELWYPTVTEFWANIYKKAIILGDNELMEYIMAQMLGGQ